MRGIDDTDLEILRLLLEDSRRPYSEIADSVGMSPPAVSDRVERLRELGVIKGFRVEIDRGLLDEGVPVLVDAEARPGSVDDVARAVEGFADAENVFVTADSHVVFDAVVEPGEVHELVENLDVTDYEVRLLSRSSWKPSLSEPELDVDCDECGNRVTGEGVSRRIDGELHHFCCTSCESNFVERYERLSEGA